jgi:folate-binding protein YgfZ
MRLASQRARDLAGVIARPDLRTLRVGGPDRVRFLNGMVTADVAALAAGQGTSAVKVTAKGRVEALVRVRAGADVLWVDVAQVAAAPLLAALDRHLIMDDCTLADATAEREVLTLLGPRAAEVAQAAGLGDRVGALPLHHQIATGEVVVISAGFPGLPGFDLLVPPGRAAPWRDRLAAAGAAPLEAEDLEVLRVEAGQPIEGRELTADVLPMEAELFDAISFTKGCYVGQEVIARGTNLGGVKFALVGLIFEGEPPVEPKAELWAGQDKAAGEVTSAVWSPGAGAWIGLGYVRVAHKEPGVALELGRGSGRRATVAARPIVRSSSSPGTPSSTSSA